MSQNIKLTCPGCHYRPNNHTLKVITDDNEEKLMSKCWQCGKITIWTREGVAE